MNFESSAIFTANKANENMEGLEPCSESVFFMTLEFILRIIFEAIKAKI